jgi:hypothetical protein
VRGSQWRGEHLLTLNAEEAAALADACALLLVASEAVPGCRLQAGMQRVLADVFEALAQPAEFPGEGG